MRATPTESATSMTPSPPGRADAYPHDADLALIPFPTGSDPGAAHFELTPDLARHGGALYGGTGAAAAVMMIATGSQTASMTHVFDGADDPQMVERRRSIAQAAAEGGMRAQEP
jgi:hypothetical protein